MRTRTIAMVALAAVLLAGCGAIVPTHSCTDDSDTFVLDWTGGDNMLWWSDPDNAAHTSLPAMDLSEFAVQSGGTLADIGGFTEMVQVQVEVIIADAGFEAIIVTGEQRGSANNVHISPVFSGINSEKRFGLGYYDPCNCDHSDFGLVYAGPMLDRSSSVVGWVNVFANVIAHEIAHNLGLDHVGRDYVLDESDYVELMLNPSSWEDRQMEQRVLAEQDTCYSGAAPSILGCLQDAPP